MQNLRPLLFFALTYLLAAPFCVLGAMTGAEILPRLPVAALMAVCPGLAALLLIWRSEGWPAAGRLLLRAFDLDRWRTPLWLAPALLTLPAMRLAEFVIQRAAGVSVPATPVRFETVAELAIFFFAGAVAEELGWSAYALPPLQDRLGALRASLLIGIVWAVLHFVPLAQAHRSIGWIAWWSLGTIATRMTMVWLFNSAGGSVFAASLYHMTVNLTWQLYPVSGSFEDPAVSGPIMAGAAAMIAVLTGGRLALGPSCRARLAL